MSDGGRASSRGANTTEEEAARHAAMVLQTANSQVSSAGAGGGNEENQLEDSVDERPMRDCLQIENSDVNNDVRLDKGLL